MRFGYGKMLQEIFYTLFSKGDIIKNLTICVACADRKKMLEDYFLPAFLKIAKNIDVQLVMAVPINEETSIKTLLNDNGVKNHRIIGLTTSFSRSHYLNHTLAASKNQAVFICDVDIALPVNFIQLFKKYVSKHTAWFPICVLNNEADKFDRFYEEGTGLVGFINKNETLRFDGSIKTWGNEDWIFLYTLYQNKIYPIRSFEKSMVHHYHLTVEKLNYKKKW